MIMAAWERFLDATRRPTDSLRSLVDGSWQRCQQHNVDPDKRSAPPPVEASTLAAMKQNHSELLEVSAPIMANARDFLAETGTVMALADTSCTILTMEGDDPTLGVAENIHLLPGAAWSERLCGTNAIGTALAVGEPVQIHSAEHYCAGIKRWTCSATVIRHPHDGEIIGVVDVSGLSESYAARASRSSSRREPHRSRPRCARWSGATISRRSCALDRGTDGLVRSTAAVFREGTKSRRRRCPALGADLDLRRRGASLARRLRAMRAEAGFRTPAWVRRKARAGDRKNCARLGHLALPALPCASRTVAARGPCASRASRGRRRTCRRVF